MRAKFIRGQDPKDSMSIGLIGYRKIDEFLDEMVKTHGGTKSIIEKEENIHLHYFEGCWSTKNGWKYYIFYDMMEEKIKWYVSSVDIKEDRVYGKDTFEEATEWIRLQYYTKIDTEKFNKFMSSPNRGQIRKTEEE